MNFRYFMKKKWKRETSESSQYSLFSVRPTCYLMVAMVATSIKGLFETTTISHDEVHASV